MTCPDMGMGGARFITATANMADYSSDYSSLSSYLVTNSTVSSGNQSWCFNYDDCNFQITPCSNTHPEYRYNDASSAWVLIASIIVFFMKAGFLLVELSFAQNVREKRHVVVVKHLDVFASAFGFFFIGFDPISKYSSPQNVPMRFFELTDPILWFFKFTFASNAATIIGGCLVTNRYKLRLPAAFISAFVISGIIHPIIARLIWSDYSTSLSPYRFCNESTVSEIYDCNIPMDLNKRLYILDFAGGGAVHLLGGVAGLILCLLAKLHKYRDDREELNEQIEDQSIVHRERREVVQARNFWEWLYPIDGGGESTNEAALGVFILWFCWFAFNCGSTESVESKNYTPFPYHAIPSIIAVNMIMAAASGGVVAVIIASWAQVRSQAESVNANEIANGVLSALVAITAGCPFVDYWAACLIGAIAVIIYHLGCWLEYKFKIEDTARVVPVHGACGLWSLLAVGIFVVTDTSKCYVHSTFEGLCFCHIRLPPLNFGERLAAQLIGALMMIGVTFVICCIMYGVLYVIPAPRQIHRPTNSCTGCYNSFMMWIFKKLFGHSNIKLEGNLLFTGPREIPTPADRMVMDNLAHTDSQSTLSVSIGDGRGTNHYGTIPSSTNTPKETLGTVGSQAVRVPNTPLSTMSYSTNNNNLIEEVESLN